MLPADSLSVDYRRPDVSRVGVQTNLYEQSVEGRDRKVTLI